MVADLVRRRVAVIAIPNNTGSVLAANAATQTIPIVFNMEAIRSRWASSQPSVILERTSPA